MIRMTLTALSLGVTPREIGTIHHPHQTVARGSIAAIRRGLACHGPARHSGKIRAETVDYTGGISVAEAVYHAGRVNCGWGDGVAASRLMRAIHLAVEG